MLATSFVALSVFSLASARPLQFLMPRDAPDFGTCTDPTIKFAAGLDGRNTEAFAPNNPASFNHGSALNIGVISGFICGQLPSACKANQAAIDLCQQAEQAANGKTGQAAADAFNSVITGGASSAASTGSAGSAADAAATGSDCVATTVTVTAAAAADTAAATVASTPPAAASPPAAAASNGQNFQKFTGNLGGSLPPPVLEGGKGFQVTGSDSFINLGSAIQRSCDIQHNACADKANSGGGFSVGQCDQQDTACVAANQ